MIHLVKLVYTTNYSYWVINDTYGAVCCGVDVQSAVAEYKKKTFKLQSKDTWFIVKGNCVYDNDVLDGNIILSCECISDINDTNYPELFI